MFRRYVYNDGLTTLVDSNKECLISYKGQILTKDGDRLPYGEDEDGHKTVHCLSWDGERTYRVVDLMVFQFKGLQIPKTDYDKVIGFCIDGDKDNLEAKNIGYRFKGGKLEVSSHPGYYYIPGTTGYAINIDGDMINVNTGKSISFSKTPPIPSKNIKGGYYVTRTIFTRGKAVNTLRHRAKALVFLDYPDNCDSLVVNHKDGIPGNDDISNLEWTTRGDNNTQAYENDLKNQNMRVLVRDIKTGKVTEYYSISEGARQLGLATDESLRQRILTSPFGTVFQDGTQVKLKSDTRDWIIPESVEKALYGARQRNPVLVRNCLTGMTTTYESVSAFCRATSLNLGAAEWRLKNKLRTPWFGYQFKYVDDPTPFPEYSKEEVDGSLKGYNVPKKVVARNHFSGEEVVFKSINEAASHSSKGIVGVLNEGRQYYTQEGWQYKFEEDAWEDKEDIEEYLYKLQSEVMSLDVVTGEVMVAENAAQMGSLLGLDPKRLRQSAFTRGNEIYRGYRFRLGVSSDPWPETLLYARILKNKRIVG